MLVRELAQLLTQMPQDVEVMFAYDGDVRGLIDVVWLTRKHRIVVLSPADEYIYSPEFRPFGAPSEPGMDWTPKSSNYRDVLTWKR